jgi:hypothetical protein
MTELVFPERGYAPRTSRPIAQANNLCLLTPDARLTWFTVVTSACPVQPFLLLQPCCPSYPKLDMLSSPVGEAGSSHMVPSACPQDSTPAISTSPSALARMRACCTGSLQSASTMFKHRMIQTIPSLFVTYMSIMVNWVASLKGNVVTGEDDLVTPCSTISSRRTTYLKPPRCEL